jgi:AcrR family transcriptional regulator
MGRNQEKDRIQMEQTKNKLMKAGLEVITEMGLHQVRVRDIVGRARLGIGTFYFHFKDLENFQTEVLGRAINDVREQARQVRGLRDKSALSDPEANIRQATETFFDLIDRNNEIALILLRERSGNSAFATIVRQQISLFVSELKEDLKAAASYGLAIDVLPFDVAAEAVAGMFLRLAETYVEKRVAEARFTDMTDKQREKSAQKDRANVISTLAHISLRGLLNPAKR